jgi:type IV secretion system protein VirB6
MYWKLKSLLISFILAFSCGFNINTYADDSKTLLDTIVDTVSHLNCQSKGVGDLLRSEFAHTCVPAPFFSLAVYNLVSPGIFVNSMLCLKINDESLFPGNDSRASDVPFPGGSCTRQNRIDSKNPVISFAFCNNIKLAVYNAKAIAKAAIAIAEAVISLKSPWDGIKAALQNDRSEYHDFFFAQKEDATGVTFDAIPQLWKVIKIDDRMCVATIGITGYIPVGCKYIREPYPRSIYSSFMDLNDTNDAKDTKYTDDQMLLTKCSNAGGCYQRAYNNSKTAIVITAPLIECIREMIVRLLVSRDVCSFEDEALIINSAKKETSSFFIFQRNMQKAVTAFLTLYVIIFGFKIVLTGDVPPKSELINFVLKIIFVTYFSVGININPNSTSDYGRLDGMIEWVFPFLLGGINQLAGWIIDSSPSELCKFSTDLYDPSLAHLALWDALDCRVSHYLGLDMLATLLVENQARSHDFAHFDFFSFSAPPYVYLLIPALISGNMTLVSLALMYPLLVISVGAYLVNSTVVCMIAIVILGILSPLFVPMMLFQYTRGYFESWVKLMISFLLQPMVVVVFMTTMFSVYDFGFYGNCKYSSKEVNSAITTSGIGGGDNNRKVKIFYIDNNWKDSKYSPDEVKSCKRSLGYMLNNPIQVAYDYTSDVVDKMVKPKDKTDEYTGQFDFLKDVLKFSPAMFITASPRLLFERIRDMALSLITACFSLYLMYHFSAQLSQFAADMTEGVDLSNVTINPQSVYKAGMAAVSAAGGALDKMSAGGKGGAGDKISAGGKGGGEDKISAGGDGDGEDQISLDDGGGGDHISTGSGSKGPTSTRRTSIASKGDNANISITQGANDGSDGVSLSFSRVGGGDKVSAKGISDDALDGVSTMFKQAGDSVKHPDKQDGVDAKTIEGAARSGLKDDLVEKNDYVSKFNEAGNNQAKKDVIAKMVGDNSLSKTDKSNILGALRKDLSNIPGASGKIEITNALTDARGEIDKLDILSDAKTKIKQDDTDV